jgi:hypothetical protein
MAGPLIRTLAVDRKVRGDAVRKDLILLHYVEITEGKGSRKGKITAANASISARLDAGFREKLRSRV